VHVCVSTEAGHEVAWRAVARGVVDALSIPIAFGTSMRPHNCAVSCLMHSVIPPELFLFLVVGRSPRLTSPTAGSTLLWCLVCSNVPCRVSAKNDPALVN
jgi:hypothetical protein